MQTHFINIFVYVNIKYGKHQQPKLIENIIKTKLENLKIIIA